MFKKLINWGLSVTEEYVIIRYIISGGTAAATDLVLLYILINFILMHYLVASIIAFIGSFFVSFVLQKFWTFRSHEERTHKQMVMYLGSSLFGLGLNTLLMYLFVDFIHLQVIISQFIVGGMVAFCTFFISRELVFKYKKI
ncbi:MAG: GtrA family protein [Nitrospira sp.]